MSKSTQRSGAPAPVNVPWSANPPPTPEQQAAASQIEELGDVFSEVDDSTNRPSFVGNTPDPIPPSPEERAAAIRANLTNDVVDQKSPFAPKAKAKAVVEEVVYEMGEAPLWGDLVKFVQKHGDVIIQIRHPKPLGEAIDTIYRGVTAIKHPTCEVRHIKLGWITWADAQYE